MHEFTVTRSILSIVLEKAQDINAVKISKIDLLMGRLTGYVPECIKLQFEILSRDTAAAGAVLAFNQPQTRLYCRKCHRDFTSNSLDLTCPGCYGLEIDILSGSELYVESMEVE